MGHADVLSGLGTAGVFGIGVSPGDGSVQECSRSTDSPSNASTRSGNITSGLRLPAASRFALERGMGSESQAGLPPLLRGESGDEKETSPAAAGLPETGVATFGGREKRMLEHGFHV